MKSYKYNMWPDSMKHNQTHYCSGCGHGIINRLICEIINELGIREKTIGIAPIGCAVLAYDYWNFDTTEAAHGRVPAVATGIKRSLPDRIVFGCQGDGDLAAIGTAEIVHCANRGENICIFFVNNTIYGMTQGQMAPTTLIGQKTTTTPMGRNSKYDGYPLKISEMLALLPAVAYIERTSIHNPGNVIKTKRAIKKAFQNQMQGKGFSLVEILSNCPTCLGQTPSESMLYIEKDVIKIFPLGVLKDEIL
jgi:2-oxoglutarate ferredoxin oxidoreductase subunit beta